MMCCLEIDKCQNEFFTLISQQYIFIYRYEKLQYISKKRERNISIIYYNVNRFDLFTFILTLFFFILTFWSRIFILLYLYLSNTVIILFARYYYKISIRLIRCKTQREKQQPRKEKKRNRIDTIYINYKDLSF